LASIFILAVFIAVKVLFLWSLYKNLKNISPNNRKMEPGMVWLNLIPCFSLAWIIYTVIKIRDSNELEFKENNLKSNFDLNFGVGIAYAVLDIISAIPYAGILTGIPGLVCWIIYWVTLSNMTAALTEAKKSKVSIPAATDDASINNS